jgi:hypothetical protein
MESDIETGSDIKKATTVSKSPLHSKIVFGFPPNIIGGIQVG